jgi:predicted DNA-binding transcriptional regulator AlpA
VEELAEMFGKSPDTVYRMAQQRQIPRLPHYRSLPRFAFVRP